MTLEKAIEILETIPEYTEDGQPIGELTARRLGIEALKWYQGQKERRGQCIWLLGETES